MDIVKNKLNVLSKVNNNTGLKYIGDAILHGEHCPMHTALITLRKIKGISTLVVGTSECGYYSRFVMTSPKGANGELHYVYEMDSNEVVFGCRNGLIEAIKTMDKQGAKFIFLIMTCIPALIGEDPSSIEEELEDLIDAKIVVFDGAHFKRNGYQSGYYETYELIMSKLVSPNFAVSGEVISENVITSNVYILGDNQGKEINLLANELEAHNKNITYLSTPTSLEDFTRLNDAEVIIVTNRKMFCIANILWKEKKIPYVFLFEGFDRNSIKTHYEEIFGILNILPSDEFIAYEHKLTESIIELENAISPVEFSIYHPEVDSVGISVYLSMLEMRPMLLHIDEWTELEDKMKLRHIETGQDPQVIYLYRGSDITKISPHGGVYITNLTKEDFGYARTSELLTEVVNKIGGLV